MTLAVSALDHLVLTCRDVEESAAWYARVLGMQREAFGPHGRVSMRFGAQKLNLRPCEATQEAWFSGVNSVPGAQDLCFLVADPAGHPEATLAHLRDLGVAVELGPVPKEGARGPINSVYVRDPDGNLVEISSYAGTTAG